MCVEVNCNVFVVELVNIFFPAKCYMQIVGLLMFAVHVSID